MTEKTQTLQQNKSLKSSHRSELIQNSNHSIVFTAVYLSLCGPFRHFGSGNSDETYFLEFGLCWIIGRLFVSGCDSWSCLLYLRMGIYFLCVFLLRFAFVGPFVFCLFETILYLSWCSWFGSSVLIDALCLFETLLHERNEIACRLSCFIV